MLCIATKKNLSNQPNHCCKQFHEYCYLITLAHLACLCFVHITVTKYLHLASEKFVLVSDSDSVPGVILIISAKISVHKHPVKRKTNGLFRFKY